MIGDRHPMDLACEILPVLHDDVVCLSCNEPFTVVRNLGVDYRRAKCPFCGQKNVELESAAPLFHATEH